jgi:dipeptidyl aminopeptidase/acylaminoacyl peptidase
MKFAGLIYWTSLVLGLCGCAGTTPLAPTANPGSSRIEGNLVLDGMPERAPLIADAMRSYQSTRPATFLGWLPDDAGILVSLRFGEVPQLARVTVAEGMRTQLTYFDEPITQAWISPDAEVNGAIFAKDRGGDEYYQLYFLSFANNTARILTDGSSRNENAVIAADGRHFAYSSTHRNGRDFDIWVGDLTQMAGHRLVLEKGGSWAPLDFSSDGSKLLVQEQISASDTRIHVLDIETGKLDRVTVGTGISAETFARFDADNQHVLVVTDALDEFPGLVRIDLETGIVVPLQTRQQWGIESFDLDPKGRYLSILRNIDGSSNIAIYDRKDAMQEVGTIGLDQGVATSAQFNHAGTEIGFAVSGPQIPGDVFSRTLNSGTLTRWTRGETGGIDPRLFVTPTTVRYGANDPDPAMLNLPRQIPAYVYKPNSRTQHPVLILIHGGPESQARPIFSDFIQFLVRERGIAVVVPNVRGSAGYGKTYLNLDNGQLRENSVQDIGALIGWIGTQPDFDSQRIAVMGGSYGGYMVLASMVHFSEQLRAAVDIVGISNFVTFLENTNPYRVDQRRPEYGDERDPEMRKFLTEISPLTHAAKIQRPLFVVQGANDPRVPRSEAEQILKAVRGNGQTAWYMLATDEGHGFRKKDNRDRLNEAVIQFLDQYLLSTTP